jgi:hypothetical protein
MKKIKLLNVFNIRAIITVNEKEKKFGRQFFVSENVLKILPFSNV